MFTGVKVMSSCWAFGSCIPGGMIISEAPFGKTKPLVVEEVLLEEEEAFELDDIVLEPVEAEGEDEEEAMPEEDVNGCVVSEDVLVPEEVVTCMPENV
jgi:hypothetical protein